MSSAFLPPLLPTCLPVLTHSLSTPRRSLHTSRRAVAKSTPSPFRASHGQPPRRTDDASSEEASELPHNVSPDDLSLGDPFVSDASMLEMDRMVQEWIGSDLSRWEWYEHLKSRRRKMKRVIAENENRIDEEFNELRRSFMECDAIFGTGFLDGQSRISPAGWGVIVLTMIMYVTLGYAAVHFVVYYITDILAVPPF